MNNPITDAALTAGGLWVLGFVFSRVKWIPNDQIPILLLLIGAPAQMQALNGDWMNLTHWLGALTLAGSATGLNEAVQKFKERFTKPKDPTDSP